MGSTELRAENGSIALGGTLHRPNRGGGATLLMVPGSGPSDRDNDGYFTDIRSGLLEHGIAVASFDKRGVGESSGDWHDSGPAEQAADVAVQLALLRSTPGVEPYLLGLFGHSQGGWVVLDVAAADAAVAFVVTNSGPGVTMAEQERYATEAHLRADGAPAESVAAALARQDELVALVRKGADIQTIQEVADGEPGPQSDAELELVRRWLDHDPRTSLGRMARPLLAIFGEMDLVVPVEESWGRFRAAYGGPSTNLELAILPGADHRLQVGYPPTLHRSYLRTLCNWIVRVATPRR